MAPGVPPGFPHGVAVALCLSHGTMCVGRSGRCLIALGRISGTWYMSITAPCLHYPELLLGCRLLWILSAWSQPKLGSSVILCPRWSTILLCSSTSDMWTRSQWAVHTNHPVLEKKITLTAPRGGGTKKAPCAQVHVCLC